VLRTGYIISKKQDLVWFIGLPFLAIIAALASQFWLSAVVAASLGLWITPPHHFVTWLRTYALPDEWRYYRSRLIVGPLVIATTTLLGLKFAPITLLLLVALWDHQHSLMQQFGFARIYDFKAKTGVSSTAKFDLMLHWVLYVNLLLTSPLFTTFWVRELYHYQIPVSVEFVRSVQFISWALTAAYISIYLGHIWWTLRNGIPVNPLKYAFIGSSFFLWYFVSWHTNSILIQEIAHKIMHGIQYIVIVKLYLRQRFLKELRETEPGAQRFSSRWLNFIVQPRHIVVFLGLCGLYALFFQLLSRQPLEVFGFGVIRLTETYSQPIPAHGMQIMTDESAYHTYAALLIYGVQLLHYYVDSFIWKVSDKKVQGAL
jgi:hypothetical protein